MEDRSHPIQVRSVITVPQFDLFQIQLAIIDPSSAIWSLPNRVDIIDGRWQCDPSKPRAILFDGSMLPSKHNCTSSSFLNAGHYNWLVLGNVIHSEYNWWLIDNVSSSAMWSHLRSLWSLMNKRPVTLNWLVLLADLIGQSNSRSLGKESARNNGSWFMNYEETGLFEHNQVIPLWSVDELKIWGTTNLAISFNMLYTSSTAHTQIQPVTMQLLHQWSLTQPKCEVCCRTMCLECNIIFSRIMVDERLSNSNFKPCEDGALTMFYSTLTMKSGALTMKNGALPMTNGALTIFLWGVYHTQWWVHHKTWWVHHLW